MEDLNLYLSGKKLYGDDFTSKQIEDWYNDEKEGYADLGAKNKHVYKYQYHSLNKLHGFKYFGNRSFAKVLGLGSTWGDEFLPIASQIQKLTILEPSIVFQKQMIHGIAAEYIKPAPDGKIPFDDCSFDLITCLDVLHHIPNVTALVNEIFRCLSIVGYALIREPVVSMGDWSKPRAGVTKHERGIPIELFRNIISASGFSIVNETLFGFRPVPLFWGYFGRSAYNSDLATRLDAKLSGLFKWNLRYHAYNFLDKIRPTSVYFVLTKIEK